MRTGTPRVATRGGDPTLTFRASLNALAALVDYAARAVVQLVLAPLLLTFLGAAGYGAWQVLQKLIGHTTPAGGRPGEALKWVVAQGQSTSHSTDEAEVARRQHQVGTAIAVWALFLPLVVVLGAVLAWISPELVHAHPDDVWAVRAAAGVLVLNVVVLGIAAVPQSVLLGQNLGYRRLGLSTAMLLVGGGLAAFALWQGWGLVGVAAATVATTTLSGLTYLHIVRGQVSWWGVRRPVRGTVRAFVGLSWWFLLWNLVMQMVKGSDVLVLSAVAGASAVAVYSLTSFVPQSVTDLVFMVISATMPGLGGLVGAARAGPGGAGAQRDDGALLAGLGGRGSDDHRLAAAVPGPLGGGEVRRRHPGHGPDLRDGRAARADPRGRERHRPDPAGARQGAARAVLGVARRRDRHPAGRAVRAGHPRAGDGLHPGPPPAHDRLPGPRRAPAGATARGRRCGRSGAQRSPRCCSVAWLSPRDRSSAPTAGSP